MPTPRKETASSNPGSAPTSTEPTQPVDAPASTEPTAASPAATDPDVVSNPNPVGLSAKEMQQQANAGYHDSLSGRPVDANGNFTDKNEGDEGPIPSHRIVANNWPELQGSSQGRVEDPHAVDGESATGTR